MAGTNTPRRGTLAEHSLAEILRALLREKRNGCLSVTRGRITRRLYLREGMIIYGSSNEKIDRLGEILVAQGKLSRADARKYWEQSRAETRLLGITLLLNGRITPTDLFQGVTAQVVTILNRLQKWRAGEYEFEEGQEPAAGSVLLRIPLALYLGTDAGGKERKQRAGKKAPAKTKRRSRREAGVPEEESRPPESEPVPEEHEIVITDLAAEAGKGRERDAASELASRQESIEECERIAEVAFHVQELRKRIGQGPHALLGVKEDAGFPAVQLAYHRLAKILDAERLPQGILRDMALENKDVFHEVTSAFQALAAREERRKAEQVAGTVRGGFPGRAVRPAAEAEDQARRYFFQGRDFITKGNYWQAANALRQAVRLRPEETAYRRLLGLALVQTKRLHEAEEHIQEAIRIEPSNADNFLTLGRIYTTGRLYRKAREAYQRVLRLDPRNEAAREELAELPDEPSPEKKRGVSFIKKLFGKG